MITGDQIAIAKETCRVLGMGTAVHDYNHNPNPNPSPNPTPNPTPAPTPNQERGEVRFERGRLKLLEVSSKP